MDSSILCLYIGGTSMTKRKRKKTVLEELIEIEARSPDLFEALAKEDKSLIKDDD
jgi:hypothetical protein